MDNLHDVVLAMFGVAIAAVMLIAGEVYLVTGPVARDLALGTAEPHATLERPTKETVND
jgi:hypothetical protein